MNHIQNHSLCKPTPFNKTVAGLAGVIAITSIAVCIIGLTTSQGPFNAISQLGSGNIGILLGTSIFLLILDLVWMGVIKKNGNKTKEPLAIDIFENTPLITDVAKIALSYLDASELIQLAKANNSLAKDLIKDLEPLLPKITMIDESFWKREEFADLGLTFSDVPPISVEELKNVASKLIPEVEGDAGVTLLTIPKGLTFNMLVTIAEHLVGAHGIIFSYIYPIFREQHGNKRTTETYRVVLTNNVLKGTRNLSVQAQKDHAIHWELVVLYPKL